MQLSHFEIEAESYLAELDRLAGERWEQAEGARIGWQYDRGYADGLAEARWIFDRHFYQ